MYALHVYRLVLFLVFAAALARTTIAQQFSEPRAIVFNQEWLEHTWNCQRPVDPVSVLLPDHADSKPVDPTDRFAVVKYVLTQIPDSAVVYPSERYYYFKFWCGHRLISGNLRFCHVNEGKVYFGYFDEFDSSFMNTGVVENKINGLVEVTDDVVRLTFSGIQKSFRLDRSWQDSDGLELLDDEELVSGILDESGYYFWLVYNRPKRRLYYVLNELKTPEHLSLVTSGGVQFSIGQISRFVFYLDEMSHRKILVGVYEDKIQKNNYFDGPFDQVPPDLNIKSILEEVYPYVKDRGGIDENGNFISLHHSRVAISPYVKYADTSSFLTFAAQVLMPQVSGNLTFMDLVYESKMDFHLTTRGAHVGQEVLEAVQSKTQTDTELIPEESK